MRTWLKTGPLIVLLAACGDLNNDFGEVSRAEIQNLQGPAPTSNSTPMQAALECVAANRQPNRDLRIAISDITDGSGVTTVDNNNLLTQRPDLMFAVGLARTGVRIINRNSTRVAEWELNQAMEMRLGEGGRVMFDGESYAYRPVEAGTILGSTHYVNGALTEVNWNIRSSTTEGALFGFAAGARTFYISVAADIMLTNTRTTEIVMARSYQKQIVGRETNRGVFRFFDVSGVSPLGPTELFDMSIGEQQNEPVQRAVRWLLEMAAYDIAASLTNTHDACDPVVAAIHQAGEPDA